MFKLLERPLAEITHLPFIIGGMEKSDILDLGNKRLVKKGLSHIPHAGMVAGYFIRVS